MKITNSRLNKAYSTSLKVKEELAAKKSESAVTEHTDTVSMSQEALKANFASQVSKNITKDIESSYSAEKLSALKEKIKNGEYHVSSEDLADALLAHTTWEA